MSSQIPVAVVGVSALLPGSEDVDGFWRSVLQGVDQIKDVPASHWDKVSVILGTAPLELLATMASRLQRPVWLKALRESGVTEDAAQAVCDRIADHYVPWQEASFPGLLSNVVAGRIANKFDLHGTNCTTDAACASSLAALSAGVNELALGKADMVITGGVDTLNDITMYMCFSKTPALSPTGDCKPFSDAADGTILGEGLVMFALKRLADAERDGDHIYAVLKGVGTASDGRSTAIYAPLPDGQARALRRTYESAGYGPDTVELVEAHGTGTTAGDLAEFTALRTVFSESGRADSQWCALGSVKSQIGHTKSAAGAAGMLKAVLALHHKVLPPTIKVDQPSPRLDLANSPLYLNTQARPWIRDAAHPRRASVSSFGFGGSNFHLTLEEYMPAGNGGRTPWRTHSAPAELVLLSAATPAELVARAGQVDVGALLADVARETQSAFVPTDAARLAIVASSSAELEEKLQQAVAGIGVGRSFSTPTGITYAAGDPEPGRVGFLFSGQGSQYVGMGADLAMEFPAARSAWDTAAGLDHPVHSVVFPVPVFSDADRDAQQAALTATECAQPALAVQSLAQLALLDSLKVSPDAVAGHSFGELVALHTAGAFSAETLVRLARKRGEAMRDAGSVAGVMLAVSAGYDQVSSLLSDVDGVWIANHNAPDQVVVSGSVAGISALEGKFASAGVTARRLDTATAFHSPLVAPASASLLEYLREVEISAPRMDVFGNTDAAVYPTSPDTIRERVAAHLAAPVRFVEEIEAMYAAGVRTFVEVGADATITGMVGRILGDRPHLAVSLDRKGKHGVTALFEALGKLSVNGIAADFDALWSHNAPPVEQSDDQRPRLTKQLSGANYGKPYPPVGGAAELPAPNVPVVADAPVVAVPVVSVPPSDIERLVLGVVADKTGYPAEILTADMDLEVDLGIDSIKRVEILATVRRTVPGLPEMEPTELGTLRTLGEIIDRLRGGAVVVHQGSPVEPQVHEGSPDEPQGALARHAVRVVEAPAPGLALKGLRDGKVIVTDDGGGVAAQVVARLVAAGIDAAKQSTVPADAYGVIHLGGLRDVTSIDDAIAVQRDVFAVARTVAQNCGVFVTVQDTGGDFGISGRHPDRAWLGGIAGLTRTAAREWPSASVKAIDCERGRRTSGAVAEAIVRELLGGGSTPDVGLRADGTRTMVKAVPAQVDTGTTEIGPDSVIVATGGARGVTAEALRELAGAHRPRLVLLGRTPLNTEPAYLRGATDEVSLKRLVVEHAVQTTGKPPLPAEVNAEVTAVLAAREVLETVMSITDAGSEVRYVAVDARDSKALAAALDDVRQQWGPITGIVHGAGVLADKRIAEKTDDQFDRVFDTKVSGLRALLDATAGDPLKVLCVFSSISAHAGNPGQCDYAMANEVLNQVAHAQRAARPDCVVRSIAWGPWEGGMVSPSLAEHFRQQGVPLIPVRDGARAFVAELTGGRADTHVVIAAGDGARAEVATGEIELSEQSHPYLADHAIAGRPVVPVALVLEWFTAAGSTVVKDVHVLRKLGLGRVTVQRSGDSLEVLGEGMHYRATVGTADVSPGQWEVPADLRPVGPDIYDGGILFHGPRFQSIQEIEGISASGAAAVLAGARELGWCGRNWHTDPAAVDGGLQLALLWAREVLGRATLPMGVAECRTYQRGWHDGTTRCVVRARNVWSDSAECDIALLGEDGTVRAELLGVSLVARPA